MTECYVTLSSMRGAKTQLGSLHYYDDRFLLEQIRQRWSSRCMIDPSSSTVSPTSRRDVSVHVFL